MGWQLRPSKESIQTIARDLDDALDILRRHIVAQTPIEIENALAGVETFCAIALRVLSQTNPSKLRSAAMTVEISARIHNRQIVEEDE